MSYGASNYGAGVYGDALQLPAPPSNLLASIVTANQVALTWVDNASNETGVTVERRTGAGAWGVVATLGINIVGWVDTTTAYVTTYTYRARAFNTLGASGWSNEASITTPSAPVVTVPAAPSALVVSVITAGYQSLTWVDNADNETGFAVQRRVGAGAWADLTGSLAPNTTTYADTTTTYATSYTYRVRATNSAGASAWSNEASVTTPASPAAQTGGRDVQVWVGPLRGEVPTPVVAEGADWTPPAGWVEASQQVGQVRADWDGHQINVTLTLAGLAMDTALWTDHRQVVIKAQPPTPAGTPGPWRVLFVGYVVGERPTTSAAGSPNGAILGGSVMCRQEWHYLTKQRIVNLTFGARDLAQGKPATASSTIVDPAGEVGVEYLTTQAVGPDQAVDGVRDTVWISNQVADPAPPALLNTGKKAIIGDLFNGAPGLAIGGNGRCRYIGLYVAHVVAEEGFEAAPLTGWASIRAAVITRSSAWAATGSWSMLITANPTAAAERAYSGLTPEVEVAVSFTLRSATGATVSVDTIVSGDQAVRQRFAAPVDALGRRYTVRVPASRGGGITLRFAAPPDAAGSFYVDDVRIAGGVEMAENSQPYRRIWLVWENGLGGSGYADIANGLDGLAAIGGDRWVFLVDDADLFRSQFDSGDATVVQYRGIATLAGLDFASGRGRLRLAYYRRWPDLPEQAQIWDDVQLASLPAFAATQSLVRTQVSPATWVMRTNPAPGGQTNTGAAWLNVDLGAYDAPTTQQPLDGVTTSVVLTLDSTERLAAYGSGYVGLERVYYQRLSSVDVLITRTAPVPHTAGEAFYLEVDSQRVTLPLISTVGWRRRPGTPPIMDFDVIASVLPNPGDPAVPDVLGNTWGAHQDWYALATVRNWSAATWTAVVGREGDWSISSWPPPVGWTRGWGRQARHLRLVIHRMAPYQGSGSRAKVNSLVAYEADMSSGGGGAWLSTGQADVRGIVGHLLVNYAGIDPAAIIMDRGTQDGIGWSAAAASLPMAASTVAEAISSLESRGRLRVVCTAGGAIRVLPDPLTTSAAFQAVAATWTETAMVQINGRQEAASPVSQVEVSARNHVTEEVYSVRYPQTPAPLGDRVQVTDLILGSLQDAYVQAQREFRQRNARWSWQVRAVGGLVIFPEATTRHVIAYSGADAAGVEWGGRNAIVEQYSWQATVTPYGTAWSLDLALREVQGWA